MTQDLVGVHLSLYSGGTLVLSQECKLFARDWAAMQADPNHGLRRGSDGKPIVCQTQVTPEGAVTIAVYQES
jgi:hypothetical protein